MYFLQNATPKPQLKKPLPPRRQESTMPNWIVLVGLWLFSATIGPFCGYLPPRFKPFWLSQAMLISIFLSWIVIGTLVLVYDGSQNRDKGFIVFCLVAGVAGLCNLIFGSESNESTSQSYREQVKD